MICSLIKRLIDWDQLPMECVGIANNGAECLVMIEALRPDIVITDIRMPGLDGLELIKKCYESQSATRFIIISGYAQFDYAQQAIKYGVSDFLIKPIQKDELNESLARVISSLAGTDVAAPQKAPASDLRQFLVHSLLFNDFTAENYKNITDLNQAFSFHFAEEGVFLPITVCLDAKEEAQGHTQTILSNIEKILHDEIALRSKDHVFVVRGHTLYALFQFVPAGIDGAGIALQYAFDRIQNAIQPYGLYHATMGKGAYTVLAGLQAAFLKAVCAVEGRRFLGLDVVHDGSDIDLRMAQPASIAVQSPNHALIAALQTLDAPDFCAFFLQEYHRQMPDMERFPYCLCSYTKAFLLSFSKEVRKACGENALPEQREALLLRQMDECLTGKEIVGFLEVCAQSISCELQSARPDIKTILLVKDYIDENYHRRITLEEAAKEVFLSAAYLGILFKRETGENFTDYLAAVRIEKAKELLKDVRFNVNQVSDRVGYKDTHHFSKLFKRAVGISPVQYRKFFSVESAKQTGRASL